MVKIADERRGISFDEFGFRKNILRLRLHFGIIILHSKNIGEIHKMKVLFVWFIKIVKFFCWICRRI